MTPTAPTGVRHPASSGSQNPPVLEIRGLEVSYGYSDSAVRALRGVDLTLHQGEVLGLAGESGCGKSTLVYAATRLLPPPGIITGGEVILHGDEGPVDVLRMSDAELRATRWQDTAIVFQGAMNSLNPVHRIGRQITDAIKAHRPGWSRARRDERARELLEMVGIAAGRITAYPHELSGGMRQRVMIAMALALEPKVLIMDEPTTALDVVMQRQIVEQIVDLRDRLGFSVVFITHDVSLLVEIADRIAIMYAGEIVEQATADEVYRHPRHPYSHGLLTSFPPLHGPRRELQGIPGAPPDLQSLPSGCPFRVRCPHAMPSCARVHPELGPTALGEEQRSVACLLHDPQVRTAEGVELPASLAV
ncbi:peptide/nickel transport system ATP-binding protein [Sediminihabitans luteus]|uniref:Peptide/nickel transport system ATP-binding protein n=1 Tax=Sediminihabitans luteus TaxID=1138585 RepID=A0A2M9D030_9CELL|nr:ABC transporter ATP-binding protein [Sediminihabitans luteus]PJJ77520.1 peptide/nickel transport system ATP-binding protein [Sediminihabitans luteus]GII98419.1 dipeptide/oligopeptide/nickel ABC transporter ATP-binding protein [Sediminihabitans luteus]